ncbi:MAG TPA: helix-turn-helix transcriptional regulator [Chthonomonadaceae bacterium]|nr:helix-turn-helix transcriptional regulator [Chthonomonadaceae bacterium]
MEIYEGSGNVFADLGLPNPEERQAKAHLANLIEDIIRANGWTQTVAAERMGLMQPDVSDIVRGRLKRFTLDRLFRCLNALDQDVEITVRPKRPDRNARVLVAGEPPAAR